MVGLLIHAMEVCQVKTRERAGDSRLVLPLLVTVASGLVMGAGFVVEIPPVVGFIALACFAAAAVTVGYLVNRQARADGTTALRALGGGTKSALRWFFYFLP